MTVQTRARPAVAAALIAAGLVLAGCSAEEPDAPTAGVETQAAPAQGQDCDCRRSVKTPLKNPITPAGEIVSE